MKIILTTKLYVRSSYSLVLATGFAIVIAFANVAPAHADAPDPANDIATVASAAADAVDSSIEPTRIEAGTQTTYSAPSAAVVVPKSDNADIQMGTPYGAPIVLSLPDEVNTKSGALAADGSVAYVGKGTSASVSVTVGVGAVQQSVVIANSSTSQSFTFELDDRLTPSLRPDGGVTLETSLARLDPRASADQTPFTAASVSTPWAVDANGSPVPTHFEVHRNALVQIVDFTSATAFPVVADPTVLYFWWGQGVKFSKSETKAVAASADSGWPQGLSTLCGFLYKFPATGAACGVVSYIAINLILNTFKDARAKGKCVQVNLPPYITSLLLGSVNLFLYNWAVVSC